MVSIRVLVKTVFKLFPTYFLACFHIFLRKVMNDCGLRGKTGPVEGTINELDWLLQELSRET